MEELVITVGSSQSLELQLLDEHDAPEVLSGADRASFAVRESLGAATNVLLRSTAAPATLTLAPTTGLLTATLTGAEADALVPGLYVGEVGVRFGSDDQWKFSEPFRVRIQPAGAPKVGA